MNHIIADKYSLHYLVAKFRYWLRLYLSIAFAKMGISYAKAGSHLI
jgi:hypothetical protein